MRELIGGPHATRNLFGCSGALHRHRVAMSRLNIPPREQIEPNTPLRLNVAATLAFPDGSMSASGLRREAARGRLIIERIAGKDFTTLANIEQMRELCRVEAKGPDCGSGQRVPTEEEVTHQSGSSATEAVKRAQAVLRTTLLEQNESSPRISPTSTQKQRARSTENRSKSPSRTS